MSYKDAIQEVHENQVARQWQCPALYGSRPAAAVQSTSMCDHLPEYYLQIRSKTFFQTEIQF